jgi:hypothetical protein
MFEIRDIPAFAKASRAEASVGSFGVIIFPFHDCSLTVDSILTESL